MPEEVIVPREPPKKQRAPLDLAGILPGVIALILTLGVSISMIILAVDAEEGPPTYVLATVFGAVVGAVAVYVGVSVTNNRR